MADEPIIFDHTTGETRRGRLAIIVNDSPSDVAVLRRQLAQLRAEHARYCAALIECATIAGADVSDGPPTWPDVAVWAVQEVRQLRDDADEETAAALRRKGAS